MFKFLKSQAVETVTVTAHLPTCLRAEDRASRYDEPVQKMLTAEGLGAVNSAGSITDGDARVKFIEIKMNLNGLDSKKLDRLVAHFDSLGSPKGSWFQDAGGKVLRPFGTTEVVVLELDPAVLPANTPVARIAADLMSPIEERVSSAGRLQGTATFPQGVELYFHCRSPRIVETALAELLIHHPLCRNARVYRLAA